MQNIVNTQLKIQIALGHGPFSTAAVAKMDYIRDLCLALNVEVAEILQELPWKPWRKHEDQVCDFEAARDEVSDIIIFAIDIWLQLNHECEYTVKLVDQIKAKQAICIERIKNKYNKTGD